METEKIYKLSELLAAPPSDEELTRLFPHPKFSGKPCFTHDSLLFLNLQCSGMTQGKIAEHLSVTQARVNYWIREILYQLKWYCPQNLQIDVPVVLRLTQKSVPYQPRYQRLSDLLRDMPDDRTLERMYAEMGHLSGRTVGRFLTHRDLYIVEQRVAGRTYASIAEELGVSKGAIRQVLKDSYLRLVYDLKLEIDVLGIFPQQHRRKVKTV